MNKTLLILLLFSNSIFAQQKTGNELYLSGGYLLAALQYSVNYSKSIINDNNSIKGNLNLVAGFGELFVLTTSGYQYKLSLNYISGLNKNHFEIGSGIYRFDRRQSDGSGVRPFYAPVINLGYKYLKPQGGLSFRTGLGYPELLYTSFGYAF